MLPPFDLDDFDPRERDRPLTFHWTSIADWTRLPELPWSSAKGKRGKCWNAALNSILTEAVLAHDEGRWVSYSRRKEFYAGLTRYHGTAYTFATVTSVIAELVRLGLVEEERASPGQRGWQSRFRATPKLIQAFRGASFKYQLQGLIRLKDEDGQLIDYRDTDATRRMQREMERINEFLAAFDLQLNAPDIMRTAHHLIVDGAYYRQTTPGLYRVFNRGSFSLGGRLYGWWQSLPKARRRQLLLNGEAVVEPDFEQMHVSMLYAMSGQRLEGDAYETGEFPREHGKLAFNVALNAKTLSGAIAALANKPDWPYSHQETARLLAVLKQRNAPIADYLHADMGIRLMRKDSDITLDVMKACAKAGIPALPIHDSILTPARYEGRVAEIMEASAARRFNGISPCRVRVSAHSVPQTPSARPASCLPVFSSLGLGAGGLEAAPCKSGPASGTGVQLDLFGNASLADPLAFGRRVREMRDRMGLSQSSFGRLIGCRQPHVANVERGRDRLSGWSHRRLRDLMKAAA
jgi:hypothetical protein